MPIYFYSNTDEYGALSNFSPHGIEMDGVWWPTVEHYFQAQKFHDADYREKIRATRTPKMAKSLGRSRALPIRGDWEEVKETLMLAACRKKYQTHAAVRELLLSTGEEQLIENAANDYYWGCGRTGSGKNRLGVILMQVRGELRAA
jgi:hypothetical protein